MLFWRKPVELRFMKIPTPRVFFRQMVKRHLAHNIWVFVLATSDIVLFLIWGMTVWAHCRQSD